MLLPTCPGEAPAELVPVALAAALIPIAADAAVSAFTKYLEERKSELSAAYVARGTGELVGQSNSLVARCLVVIRGRFGGPMEPGVSDSSGNMTKPMLKILQLVQYPDLYFEARLERVATTTGRASPIVFNIVPNKLYFRETAAERVGSGTKTILITLLIGRSFLDPTDPDAAKNAYAVVPFFFKNISVGTAFNRGTLSDQEVSVSIAAPEPGQPLGGINLVAQVAESEDPSFLESVLLQTVTGHKDELSKALQDLLKNALQPAADEGGSD
jgi:hypothetical protein